MRQKAIQILMSALLLTIGVTCGALAQEQKTNLKDKMVLVDHNGVKFLLRAQIEIPADNPVIERLLCERLFGSADDSLETALKKYLDRFDKIHTAKNKYEYEKYTDGGIGIVVCHSTFFNKKDNFYYTDKYDILSREYKKMSRRYAPFYYYIKKSKDKKMDNVDIKEVDGWFTYDMEAGKLLGITDVFTKEAIEKLNIDMTMNNEEVLFSPYDRSVAYFVTENGKKTVKTYSICKEEGLFADWMKPFTVIAEKKQKEIDEIMNEIRLKQKEQKEERNKATLENIKPYYQSQNTKMKGLYLYIWGDTCYVSGIHKDIMKMTDEEIDKLASNKGCSYIADDIREAKEFIKNGGSAEQIFSGDEDAYKKNGNAYPASMCDSAPTPSKPLDFKEKKSIWGLKNGDKSFIRYVIDSEGNLRMPIVFIKPANDFVQKSADFDKFHISKIREAGKWKPATKDGKNVNAVCISAIGYTEIDFSTYFDY